MLYSPVFHYSDAARLKDMIKKDKKDDTRLVEGVCQVMKYCMNISQCRRVQVLQYFDEVFHERDCNRRCDVCAREAQVISRDVTIKAIDAVNLVKSMPGRYTMKHCKDVFLGSNNHKIKETGHDRLLGHGKGRDLGPKTVDQLFVKLVAMEVLHEIKIPNSLGWYNYYLQVSGC
jgi:superfamily II DNA helicase RecQ